ncbi:hypothetical protein KBD45_00455 [Candidatus Dojkabacteria bacterium]|nr:hypothetical protein [Candidatus Dojkabacteria bacterium]
MVLKTKTLKTIFIFILLLFLVIEWGLIIEKKRDNLTISINSELSEPTIKVMSWNIGARIPASEYVKNEADFQKAVQAQTERIAFLGNLIVTEKVDVVFLQELNNEDPGWNKRAKIKQVQVLQAYLRNSSWPMHVDTQQYTENGTNQSLVILSRYPFDSESKKYMYDLRDNKKDKAKARSAQSIKVIGTPIGDVRLSNIHTHGTAGCDNMKQYYEFYKPLDSNISILGGDTNLYLNQKPKVKAFPPEIERQQQNCDLIPWDDIVTSCIEKSNCIEKGTFVDWIFIFGNSDFNIKSSFSPGNINNFSDQHPVVFAEIAGKAPLELASPTVNLIPISTSTLIPSITPTQIPTIEVTPGDRVVIDLNEDGKLDIADFALFVEYYKLGNAQIDYDNDGKTQRDIEDFSYFINKYKEAII